MTKTYVVVLKLTVDQDTRHPNTWLAEYIQKNFLVRSRSEKVEMIGVSELLKIEEGG